MHEHVTNPANEENRGGTRGEEKRKKQRKKEKRNGLKMGKIGGSVGIQGNGNGGMKGCVGG